MTAISDITEEGLFQEEKEAVPFFRRRGVLFVLIGLYLVLTLLLYFLTMATMDRQTVALYSQSAGYNELKRDLLLFLIVGLPVLGFLIGLLVTLLPYKKERYWKKYVPFSLITILGTQLFLLAIRLTDFIILMNQK